MSAAGSKRVNVVQRKLMSLRVAPAGSSVSTTSGQPANAGSSASLAGAAGPAAKAGPPMTRQPPQNTRASVTPEGSAPENSRGSARTGSPSPSHTPFDPSL